MTSSNSELLRVADAVYPAGAIAQLVLLTGNLQINLAITVDALADTITAANHGLTTGSRFRIGSTGTVPGGLAANVDYYAIALSAGQIKAAETLAAAQNNVAINLTDGGTGAVVINEQLLTANDPIEVLIAKELGIPRQAVTVGAAAIVGAEAVKPAVDFVVTNTGAANLSYRHILIGYGASSNIGDVNGIVGFDLITEAIDQVTAPNQARQITLTFGAQQAA
jgi:hypothetical protein